MRVSSPIGELPFEPRRLRISRRGVDLEGAMGAWPAHVHLDAADVPALIRLVPARALALGAVLALVCGAAGRRRSRRRHG